MAGVYEGVDGVMSERVEYNYSRIMSAKAQMDSVYNDMALCLHRGYVNQEMRKRMVIFLQNAAADLERIEVGRD